MYNLFCRTDRIGEFLLTLPSVYLFKKHFPDAKVVLLISFLNESLMPALYWIDGYSLWRGSLLRAWSELRKLRIERVFVFNPKKDLHLLSFLLGARERVGYDRKWGFFLNRRIVDQKYRAEKHESLYDLDLISVVTGEKYSLEDVKRTLPGLFSFRDTLKGFPRDVVVVHPFTSDSRKELPWERWKKLLLERLQGREEVCVIGSPSERPRAEEFFLLLKREVGIKKVHDLVGKLTLYDLGALLKHHALWFLGLDSGPAHLSGMLGVKTKLVWSYAEPRRWLPLGDVEVIERV